MFAPCFPRKALEIDVRAMLSNQNARFNMDTMLHAFDLIAREEKPAAP
jgi:hypothetical protein